VSGSVLARRDRALTPDEQVALLRDRLGDDAVVGVTDAYGVLTVHVDPARWVEVAERCRDEELLAYDLFDSVFGIDARDEGFDVVAILYATSTGTRVALRARVPGGREAPVIASLTGLFRGADWHERETWDMFGIEFEGHPGLAPRILTVENFEGWPLRKDFPLASRVAKPWPGVKEPAELDEDGNVIEREPRLGDAPGPYELDKAMAEQAKLANPLPEPATASGEAVEDRADDAELAPGSGAVLSGETEQQAERAEEQASDAAVETAAETADQADGPAGRGARATGYDRCGRGQRRQGHRRRGAQAAGRGPRPQGRRASAAGGGRRGRRHRGPDRCRARDRRRRVRRRRRWSPCRRTAGRGGGRRRDGRRRA
jgi:NADH:ubiquinone oxidoreductase subunit C